MFYENKIIWKKNREERRAEREARRLERQGLEEFDAVAETTDELSDLTHELIEPRPAETELEELIDEIDIKKIDMSRNLMSQEANLYINGLDDETDLFKKSFAEDLKKTLMARDIPMREKGKTIYNDTDFQYRRYIDDVREQYHVEVWEIDQKIKEAVARGESEEDAVEYYREEFDKLTENAIVVLEAYNKAIRMLLAVAGSQTGVDNYIDGGAEWSELDGFNRNGRELMEKMSPPAGILRDSMSSDFDIGAFSLENMGDCGESIQIIGKIHEGVEPLTSDDYNHVIDSIEVFFDHSFDPETSASLERSIRVVEDTGMMTAVYAMNQKQRYELGKHIVERFKKDDPDQAKKGIEFLTSTSVLDVGQAQNLLEEGIGWAAVFDDEELEEIHAIRDQLEQLRKQCARDMKKGLPMNMAMEKITGSNGILYEIVFRFAAIGTVLPFVLGIKNPGNWGEIVTNPMWLGCLAVSGVTLDHVTGGIGSGYTSQAIAGIGAKTETTEESEDRYKWAAFNRVVGDNYQARKYLLGSRIEGSDGFEYDAEVLGDIMLMALDSEENISDFHFDFDEFIEYQMEEELHHLSQTDPDLENPEEEALTVLAERYGATLNDQDPLGMTPPEGIDGVADICDQLFRVMEAKELGDALLIFEESDEKRGINN
ncbi:hypothetical protein HN748_04460 [Candidatus Peregrinibacteria bacterium]|nr:hypothetical protein [Candidatus Peregrinibacteria bacterium]MBT7703463.1 hypothetical protein [Candidatus Peregrinibacteria bacterium]